MEISRLEAQISCLGGLTDPGPRLDSSAVPGRLVLHLLGNSLPGFDVAQVAVIVTCNGKASVALGPTDDASALNSALDKLPCGGDSNLAASIGLACLIARRATSPRIFAFVAGPLEFSLDDVQTVKSKLISLPKAAALTVSCLASAEELGAATAQTLESAFGADRLVWVRPGHAILQSVPQEIYDNLVKDRGFELWQLRDTLNEQAQMPNLLSIFIRDDRASSAEIDTDRIGARAGTAGMLNSGGQTPSTFPAPGTLAPGAPGASISPAKQTYARSGPLQRSAFTCRESSLDVLLHYSKSGLLRNRMPTYSTLAQRARTHGTASKECYVRVMSQPRYRTLLTLTAAIVQSSRPDASVNASANAGASTSMNIQAGKDKEKMQMLRRGPLGTLRILQDLKNASTLVITWAPKEENTSTSTSAEGNTTFAPSNSSSGMYNTNNGSTIYSTTSSTVNNGEGVSGSSGIATATAAPGARQASNINNEGDAGIASSTPSMGPFTNMPTQGTTSGASPLSYPGSDAPFNMFAMQTVGASLLGDYRLVPSGCPVKSPVTMDDWEYWIDGGPVPFRSGRFLLPGTDVKVLETSGGDHTSPSRLLLFSSTSMVPTHKPMAPATMPMPQTPLAATRVPGFGMPGAMPTPMPMPGAAAGFGPAVPPQGPTAAGAAMGGAGAALPAMPMPGGYQQYAAQHAQQQQLYQPTAIAFWVVEDKRTPGGSMSQQGLTASVVGGSSLNVPSRCNTSGSGRATRSTSAGRGVVTKMIFFVALIIAFWVCLIELVVRWLTTRDKHTQGGSWNGGKGKSSKSPTRSPRKTKNGGKTPAAGPSSPPLAIPQPPTTLSFPVDSESFFSLTRSQAQKELCSLLAQPPWVSFTTVAQELRARGLAQPVGTLGPLDPHHVALLVRQQAVFEQALAVAQGAAWAQGQQTTQTVAAAGAISIPMPPSISVPVASSELQHNGNGGGPSGAAAVAVATESGASVLVAEEKGSDVKMPLTPSRTSDQGAIGSEVPRTPPPPSDATE